MSLLLDALKKAAEQKAEKSKQEAAAGGTSDETMVDAAEDISALEDSTDIKLPTAERQLQDETEIDNSEIDTRLERTLLERDTNDETGIEVPDATETEVPAASAQMQTGEDETIIFAEDDVADFMGEEQFVNREPARAPEDETDLSQLKPADDQTDMSEIAVPQQAPEDETDLSQLKPADDQTDMSEIAVTQQAREDDTDISQPFQPGEQTDIQPPDQTDISVQQAPPGDETDIRAPAEAGEDATDFRDQVSDEDVTDISEPLESVADLEHAATQQAPPDDTDLSRVEPAADDSAAGVTDDDLSLLLVERDQTNLTEPTSATDPQRLQDQVQAMQPEAAGDEELGLVDITQHPAPAAEQTATVEAATQTSATATTGINYDTQGTTQRAESTSTRTYAPDNYDRTLMRLPSDDASKLFAGMKSDSDVVMTPDYAKKVFRSKSSAQQLQHYKFYASIAVVILLGIGVFGLFEYQEQSINIDTSLQPLKRDPMPGVVRSEQAGQDINLFAETDKPAEVDERTISIIEGADSADTEIDTATEVAEAEAGMVEQTETVTEVESEAVVTATAPETETAISPEPELASQGDVSVAVVSASSEAAPEQSEARSTPSNLSLSSSSQVPQKNLWLQQAYRAYQAGDDELALELYNKVIAVDPGSRNALLGRAAIHVQNNNARKAVEDYQTLLLANPKDSLAMTSLISVANVSPRETESQLKLMIRDEPNSPYLNFALANAYGAQNRWQEAQGHYFTALQNNPNDPNYAYNLAVSLEHISKPRAAIPFYQRALENMDKGLATFNKSLVDERLDILGKL